MPPKKTSNLTRKWGVAAQKAAARNWFEITKTAVCEITKVTETTDYTTMLAEVWNKCFEWMARCMVALGYFT